MTLLRFPKFSGFRVPMNESRDRFIDSVKLLKNALATGNFEFDGKIIKQPARELRPRPKSRLEKKLYAAALSPESAEIMAELGLGMMIIPQKPWETVEKELERHESHYRTVHQAEPPSPIASAWIYCDKDQAKAEEIARKHIGQYYVSTINHYKFDGKHFAKTKGYEFYDKISKSLSDTSHNEAAQKFVDLQVYGTPEQCIEKIAKIKAITGCRGFNGVFRYAGLDYKLAEDSLRLFASDVMPEVKRLPNTRVRAEENHKPQSSNEGVSHNA